MGRVGISSQNKGGLLPQFQNLDAVVCHGVGLVVCVQHPIFALAVGKIGTTIDGPGLKGDAQLSWCCRLSATTTDLVK